jgi:hypothetical protein
VAASAERPDDVDEGVGGWFQAWASYGFLSDVR